MNSARYFKLGLFVLAGCVLLIGGIVVFGGRALFEKHVPAETYVDESASGIEKGSAVKYRGVTIGTVKDVRFTGSKYSSVTPVRDVSARKILIEMSLDAKVVSRLGERYIRQMVDQGLRAQIKQSGFTGTAYIGLDFVDPKTHPPPALAWTPEGLYIPSIPSTQTQIVSAIERFTTKLDQVDLPATVRRVDKLLDDADRAVTQVNVPAIQGQAVSLLTEVRQSNARVKELLNDPKVDAALHDLPGITGRLQSSVARVDEILHDKRVDQILTGVSDAAANAGPAAADLKRTMRDVRALVATEQDDIRSIITDLRATIANLNALTADAKDNPSRLILSKPPERKKPGE